MPYVANTATRVHNKRGIAKRMGATPSEFSTQTSVDIYRTFVEPTASYDTPAWSQDVISDTVLEQAQITCAKMILGIPDDAKVNGAAVRSELGLMSLKRRRDIADLVYLWRIRNLGAHRLERKLIDWLREENEGVDNGVTMKRNGLGKELDGPHHYAFERI